MGSLVVFGMSSPISGASSSPSLASPLHHLHSCSSMSDLKQFHSQVIRLGLSTDNYAMGHLIKFCALSNSGDITYALHLFDSLPHPDAFIYNTIIRGHLQSESPINSFLFYSQMLHDSVIPNSFQSPVEARRVFDSMPLRDVVSWTTLIAGYSQCGFVDEAFQLFELMPERNAVTWNAMIASYVQNNRFHEAFALFRRMREEEVTLDKYLAASMLTACTGIGALHQGKWIHDYIEKSCIELDSKLVTTIIDMYCKCGCLDKAFQVFNEWPHKGISSWNCMIGGLAMHGKGEAAIELFEEMQRRMVAPDHITFVNLLSACAHSGLVEEGRHHFQCMTRVYGIEPRREHFGCMVDLLGRAGMLEEARELIDEMPISPDAGVLGALLGACKIHGNIKLAEEIGEEVIKLDPENSGRYVLLANLYARAGRSEDVAKVRKLMNDRGVKKVAGFSMIELEGAVHEFIAGGRTHPESKDIYGKVNEMLEDIRCVGYVPESDGVLLHDVEEEEMENPVYHHSEKLAIAFGLLKTKPGETIRISKNLRVCKDCHNASKLISKVFDREIIVRDRNRFHHFKNGLCSCKDYW
ncbi:pentatricopeptide repeat-containing protein At5g66520-like isoform X2 [Humulus lupulus]|uniref:pentatricopeptide repeat-containing protein At5g66520-like isoform X2 n=1 Tax=Humulus lupulus TaxID=3486 RepID=UPI002B415F91|nr:pentatricopeptide repeat-containing protein At5g66520-like isoform X2 [Humulus lupulus]